MSDQQKYSKKLQGKRILLIGGSSGIGFAVAEASVESGARVILSSSNQSRLDEAVSKLQSSYPSRKSEIFGFTVNLADENNLETNIESLLNSATDNGGEKLDHIVYTAADALAVVPIKDLTLEKIKEAGKLRFFAPLLVGKLAPQYMNPGPESSITLTTGAVSQRPIPNWTLIGSYAGGLQSMTRGMALDLAPLRVNIVSPGAVSTELWNGMNSEARDRLFEDISSKLPTGKVAQPHQVAESYLFLMRDTNSTGSMVSTNGGHLLV